MKLGPRLASFPRRMILPSILLGALVLVLACAALITPYDPTQIAIARRLAKPSLAHPFGQDEFGRDRLARVLYGGQVSLTVAFLATSIACVTGTLFGLVGAYFRGVFQFVTTRLADVVLCFPPILLALLVVTLFGPGAQTLVAVLSVLYFPVFARIAFSEALRVSALEFVEASRALGTPSRRILLRTILPNIAGPLAIQYSLTVYLINFFCDRLRDTLDPKGGAVERGKPPKEPSRASAGADPVAASRPARDDERRPLVASLEGLRLEVSARGRTGTVLIDDVDLVLHENECTALVGESGSGKSLSSLALMGLLPSAIRQVRGRILLRRKAGDLVDLGALGTGGLRALRGNDVAMIFQEPMTSLNPVHKVGMQLVEAIRAHRPMSEAQARAHAIALLARVGINEPARRFAGYPHEMSGGMRQRVMIAMALACEPKLLIADEPTTALDVTIQAEIIELLQRLRREQAHGLSLLFISHNLGIVSEIADRVVVMYSGQVVEEGAAAEVLKDPHHPYTAALMRSMPSAHDDLHSSRGDRLQAIAGAPPLPHARPAGCAFRDRCPDAIEACAKAVPPLFADKTGRRRVRCIRAPEATP